MKWDLENTIFERGNIRLKIRKTKNVSKIFKSKSGFFTMIDARDILRVKDSANQRGLLGIHQVSAKYSLY